MFWLGVFFLCCFTIIVCFIMKHHLLPIHVLVCPSVHCCSKASQFMHNHTLREPHVKAAFALSWVELGMHCRSACVEKIRTINIHYTYLGVLFHRMRKSTHINSIIILQWILKQQATTKQLKGNIMPIILFLFLVLQSFYYYSIPSVFIALTIII